MDKEKSESAWSFESMKVYVDTMIMNLTALITGFGSEHREMRTSTYRLMKYLTRLDRKIVAMSGKVDTLSMTVDRSREVIDKIEDKLNAQLPREVYDQNHQLLIDRITVLESWKATVAGRTIVIISIIGLCGGLLGVVVGHIFFG